MLLSQFAQSYGIGWILLYDDFYFPAKNPKTKTASPNTPCSSQFELGLPICLTQFDNVQNVRQRHRISADPAASAAMVSCTDS